MSKVYVISDTHFGHKKIITFGIKQREFKTIEEHDKAIVERWNSVVTKHDTVWHLGDVFFGKDGHWILAGLNGNKKLVMGNHDHYPIDIYKTYFSHIYGAAEYDGCLLTHIPVHKDHLRPRWRKNIHGHLHTSIVSMSHGGPDPEYVCASAEHSNLTPRLMHELTRSL